MKLENGDSPKTESNKPKIPKKIMNNYRIHKLKKELHIHHPAFINIAEPYIITNGEITVDIENHAVHVSLWKDAEYMLITVYERNTLG